MAERAAAQASKHSTQMHTDQMGCTRMTPCLVDPTVRLP
jgi:hypothetical protein